MESRDEPDGAIVVTHDSTRLATWLAGAALLLAATGAYDHFLGPREDDRLLGLAGATATCLLCAVAFLEKARFVIRPATRTIEWRRRWGFRAREGVLPFERVRGVEAQIPIGDQGIPSRRLSLRLDDGSELPMTAGYAPDADDAALRLATRLREIVVRP